MKLDIRLRNTNNVGKKFLRLEGGSYRVNLKKRVTIDLEHLNDFFPPFKRTVIGSNPVVPTIFPRILRFSRGEKWLKKAVDTFCLFSVLIPGFFHRCNDEFCSALAEYSPFNKEK